jgi:hypothetical protein
MLKMLGKKKIAEIFSVGWCWVVSAEAGHEVAQLNIFTCSLTISLDEMRIVARTVVL